MKLGDMVWWNGGIAIGYIYELLLDDHEITDWGLDEPSVIIGLAAARGPGVPFISYPVVCLQDEGIETLSTFDSELCRSVLDVAARVVPEVNLSKLGIFRKCRNKITLSWTVVEYSSTARNWVEIAPNHSILGKGGVDNLPAIYR